MRSVNVSLVGEPFALTFVLCTGFTFVECTRSAPHVSMLCMMFAQSCFFRITSCRTWLMPGTRRTRCSLCAREISGCTRATRRCTRNRWHHQFTTHRSGRKARRKQKARHQSCRDCGWHAHSIPNPVSLSLRSKDQGRQPLRRTLGSRPRSQDGRRCAEPFSGGRQNRRRKTKKQSRHPAAKSKTWKKMHMVTSRNRPCTSRRGPQTAPHLPLLVLVLFFATVPHCRCVT